MVPAVPQCVILYYILRCDRRGEAQRKRRSPVQLFIRERAHRGGRLAAVLAQEFQRLRLAFAVVFIPELSS
jgi:hypothetical protein